MEEEYEILENTVRDFNTKYVDNNSLKLENDTMGKDFVKMLAGQGFFSMTSQAEGGAGTDIKALSIVLENLAKSAPAVAVKTLLSNSFSTAVKEQDVLGAVADGSKSGTVTFSDLLVGKGQNGNLVLEKGRVSGEKEFVVGSDSDFIITLVDSGELVLLKSGFKTGKKHKKLGFRSIGFSSIVVDTEDFTILSKDGRKTMERMYEDLSIPVAAISLGMSEGVSQKALDYAKVRTAFGHYLKDFQPLAFDLSSLVAEMEILKRYFRDLLSSSPSQKEAMFLKHKSLTLAKDISRTSLQIHGGYGYLEDFGIEKFYRDSMALSVLFHSEEKDMEKLSGLVFESKAGFV
ncbi:MAG: acyl-CoA/acyl-ACP dehydrogenase [Thermoplasmatales archaeon]|jgi:alkylation response protein AidB-like acyl-CoA dehydrogenase|nr:acyl-CoA/acyl-ACP dehydrogenase [Thermoplasmatales archaeon]